MAITDAELMRKMINTLQAPPAQSLMEQQQVEEAFPVLRQQAWSKLYGLASKFSKRKAGQNQAKKALVPYLQKFLIYMGRKNQKWDDVTWRTVMNYLISNVSLTLPLGEYRPQRLTNAEVIEIIHDDQARKRMAKYLGRGQSGQLNTLLPLNIGSVLQEPVTGTQKDATLAQKLITALFVEAIQVMFEKAGGGQQFSAPAAPAAPGAPAAAAPAAPGAPAAAPAAPGSTATPPDKDSINFMRAMIGLPPL